MADWRHWGKGRCSLVVERVSGKERMMLISKEVQVLVTIGLIMKYVKGILIKASIPIYPYLSKVYFTYLEVLLARSPPELLHEGHHIER